MDSQVKNRIDALEILRAAAYKSFNDRRGYEWKLCISIWTAFAVYIGALVTQPIEYGKAVPFAETQLAIGTALVSVIIFTVQVYWTLGVARANKLDNKYDWGLRNEIYSELNLPLPENTEKFKTDLDVIKKAQGKLWHWSNLTELLITLLLSIVATVAAFARHV